MKIKYGYIVLMVFWLTWFWISSANQLFPALLPVIQQSLSLSTTAGSVMIGSAFLGQSISAFLSGFLCKRLGRKSIILLGVAAVSFSILFTSLTNHYLAMLFLRFLLGVGLGTYLPAAISILSDLSSSKIRGKYIGFHETAVPTGYIAGPIVAGFALFSGLSWSDCLQIWLIPVPFIIAAQVIFVREHANQQPPEHLQTDDGEKSAGSWPFLSFLLLLLALIFRGVVVSVIALLPLYWTEELGVEAYIAAFVLGLTNVLGILGQLSAGHLSDVFGRLRVLVILNLLMAVTLTVCLYMPFNTLLVICLIIFGLSNHAFFPVVFTFVSEMAIPEKKSQMLGITIAITGFSQSLHSTILGFIVDSYGFETAWFYVVVLSILSCLFLLVLRRIRRT
ncbi:MAG: MFS transporter [Candidatus Bathyarchaeia archaeon]